jgi:hypothetical protein
VVRSTQPIDFQTRELVLRADFDLLDDEGCSWVSLRFMHGPRPPDAGETVYLLDPRGSGCIGTVERVEGHYACVRPDWSTFTGDRLPSRVRGRFRRAGQ